jgi:hypothetical protein
MLRISLGVVVSSALALSVSSTVLAQDDVAGEDGAADPAAAGGEAEGKTGPGTEPVAEAKTEETKADDAEAVEDALDTGATEIEGKQYMFVGARYRNVVIPKFIQNTFADGGETMYAHTPGLEFVIRQDKFEYELFAMLGFYSFDNVPFKGATDPDTAWELIDADFKILYLGADFMWSTDDFTPGFSLMYGAGAGLGFVFGDLIRTQAYPGGGSTDPYTFEKCIGLNNPPNSGGYCDDENTHYNNFVEPSWSSGGSSPLFFPWIAAQLGLRYKFNRQFVARLDLGIMPTGAFAGVGADFGL